MAEETSTIENISIAHLVRLAHRAAGWERCLRVHHATEIRRGIEADSNCSAMRHIHRTPVQMQLKGLEKSLLEQVADLEWARAKARLRNFGLAFTGHGQSSRLFQAIADTLAEHSHPSRAYTVLSVCEHISRWVAVHGKTYFQTHCMAPTSGVSCVGSEPHPIRDLLNLAVPSSDDDRTRISTCRGPLPHSRPHSSSGSQPHSESSRSHLQSNRQSSAGHRFPDSARQESIPGSSVRSEQSGEGESSSGSRRDSQSGSLSRTSISHPLPIEVDGDVQYSPLLLCAAVETFNCDLVLVNAAEYGPVPPVVRLSPLWGKGEPYHALMLYYWHPGHYRSVRAMTGSIPRAPSFKAEPQLKFTLLSVESVWLDSLRRTRPSCCLVPLRNCCTMDGMEYFHTRVYLLHKSRYHAESIVAHGTFAGILYEKIDDAVEKFAEALGNIPSQDLAISAKALSPKALLAFAALISVQWYRVGVRPFVEDSCDLQYVKSIDHSPIMQPAVTVPLDGSGHQKLHERSGGNADELIFINFDLYIVRDSHNLLKPFLSIRDHRCMVVLPGSFVRLHPALRSAAALKLLDTWGRDGGHMFNEQQRESMLHELLDTSPEGLLLDSHSYTALRMQMDLLLRKKIDYNGRVAYPMRVFGVYNQFLHLLVDPSWVNYEEADDSRAITESTISVIRGETQSPSGGHSGRKLWWERFEGDITQILPDVTVAPEDEPLAVNLDEAATDTKDKEQYFPPTAPLYSALPEHMKEAAFDVSFDASGMAGIYGTEKGSEIESTPVLVPPVDVSMVREPAIRSYSFETELSFYFKKICKCLVTAHTTEENATAASLEQLAIASNGLRIIHVYSDEEPMGSDYDYHCIVQLLLDGTDDAADYMDIDHESTESFTTVWKAEDDDTDEGATAQRTLTATSAGCETVFALRLFGKGSTAKCIVVFPGMNAKLWLQSTEDVGYIEAYYQLASLNIPRPLLVLDLDGTLIDNSPHINSMMLSVHYHGRVGIMQEDVWIRPRIELFLALVAEYFDMKVVTKSSGRRALIILHFLDPDRRHLLKGCSRLPQPLHEMLLDLRHGKIAEDDCAEGLHEVHNCLLKGTYGTVFVPQHICGYYGKEVSYENVKACKKTLRLLFSKRPAQSTWKRLVVIMDDCPWEWEEMENVCRMTPFSENLDDREDYINGVPGDGGQLGSAVLDKLLALLMNEEQPIWRRSLSTRSTVVREVEPADSNSESSATGTSSLPGTGKAKFIVEEPDDEME